MDEINRIFRQKMIQDLFGKVDPEFTNGSVSTGTSANAGSVYDNIMEALNKLKGLEPKNKVTYCSWNFFVKLLEASNLTITAGYTLNGKTWHFELDNYVQAWVSDTIPTDDTGFQFKDESFDFRYNQKLEIDK